MTGIGILSAVLGLWFWIRILGPLDRLAEDVKEVTSGSKHTQELIVTDSPELAALTESIALLATRLEHQGQILNQQEKEQSVVLDSLQEGVLVVDSGSRIRQVNKAAVHLLGVKAEQLAGRSASECLSNQVMQQFLSTLLSGTESTEVETILGGSAQREVRVRGKELLDTHGHKVGVVLILSDTTHLRALEKLESGFLANVAHELKTPLTAIKGFAETLLDGALQDPKESERFVRIIAQQSDRLDHLTGRLLELSRLEATQGVEEAVREWHSIPDLLERVVVLCSHKSAEQSIRVETECRPDLMARINLSLMEHALRNLLENAIKYSSSEGKISLQGGEENDEVFLSVRDQGLGIKPVHHSQIFERFYRVDPGKESQGSGLGLAIVKRIVDAHAGRVELKSEPGRGSTFTIRLPRY